MSLDELCNIKEQKLLANSQETKVTNFGIESIIIDLIKDRMIEISKYIHIEQSSRKIIINLQNLQKAGYEVKMI